MHCQPCGEFDSDCCAEKPRKLCRTDWTECTALLLVSRTLLLKIPPTGGEEEGISSDDRTSRRMICIPIISTKQRRTGLPFIRLARRLHNPLRLRTRRRRRRWPKPSAGFIQIKSRHDDQLELGRISRTSIPEQRAAARSRGAHRPWRHGGKMAKWPCRAGGGFRCVEGKTAHEGVRCDAINACSGIRYANNHRMNEGMNQLKTTYYVVRSAF